MFPHHQCIHEFKTQLKSVRAMAESSPKGRETRVHSIYIRPVNVNV